MEQWWVEAFASEQHARMMAMDSATKSAKDMIQELNLAYNRAKTGRNNSGNNRDCQRREKPA